MNDEGGASGSGTMAAIGSGVLWGLLIMLTGAVIQGVWAYKSPLPPGAEETAMLIWQGLGAVVAGFFAARRAAGAGWLHGGLAGCALAMAATAIMGVLTDLPEMLAFARAVGSGAGLGALAGIAGINLGGR